jgi:hypothetical protein
MRWQNMMAASLVVLGGVAVVVVGQAPPAAACSCVAMTEQQALDSAAVVFAGELVDVIFPPPRAIESSGRPVRLIFEVGAVFKGRAYEVQSVVTAADGSSCGLGDSRPGPYLVFAGAGTAGEAEAGELQTNTCSGTRALDALGTVPVAYGDGTAPEPGSSPIGGLTATVTTPAPAGEAAAPAAGSDQSWLQGTILAGTALVAAAVLWLAANRRRSR